MTDMIKNWRHVWGQGNFPFIMVQLANYMDVKDYDKDATWPYLREAQLESLAEENTGMAVIIDIGEALDIHPSNKCDVGQRLAFWALNKSYKIPSVVPSGPIYREMVIEGDKIRLYFDYTAENLLAVDGDLKTFVIAGNNKNFKPANAVIDGSSILVSHSEIKHPVAVRYAWADNPESCNLYNSAMLPASPFRTDRWEK